MSVEINLEQANLDYLNDDENHVLKKFLIKLIYDLGLKDLFEPLKPLLKWENNNNKSREKDMDEIESQSSTPDSSKSSLSKIDDDINEAIDKLIKNDNLEEMETDEFSKNETIDLINDIVNDYLKLSSVYLIESDSFKWIACLFYVCYEKNARFYKMSEMLQLSSQIASKIVTSSSQDEANNKFTSAKKSSASFKRHQSQPFQTIQATNKNIYKKPVNLDKLLELTNQSLTSFILKIRNLTKMLNIPCELVERVDIIEINYNVSCIIFNKYKQIYQIIFNDQNDDLLFKFGWSLFICIKENYVEIGHDLVNSFYLLICCVNLIYESIDSKFIKLKTNLIEYVCKNFDADELDVKTLNEHYFKKTIVKLKLKEWFTADPVIFYKNLPNYLSILNQRYESILNALYEINYVVKINETVFIKNEKFLNNKTSYNNNQCLLVFPECLKNLPKFSFSSLSFDEFKQILIKNKNFINLNSLNEEKFRCFYEESLQRYCDIIKRSLKNEFVYNKMENKDSNLIEQIIDLSASFFVYVLENVLSSEKKKLDKDNNQSGIENVNHQKVEEIIINNELLKKSLYLLCFELVLNFTRENMKNDSSIFLIQTNQHLKFPWSLQELNLDPYDIFMFIELFVRSISLLNNNQPINVQPKTAISQLLCYLDREMVKHLNNLEELILEQLAWADNSKIWSEIEKIQLNKNPNSSYTKTTQLDEAFPLNQDLYLEDLNMATKNIPSSNQDSILSFTPAKTATTGLTNSPNKHPTITKVICSSDNLLNVSNSMQKVINSNSLQSNQSQSNIKQTLLKKKESSQRILNLNYRMVYFFRKFYNLANNRLRDLVDKLELVTKLTDLPSISAINTPNLMSSTNPIITPIQQTPILTPISSNLQNENSNLLLKNIWNIFEYSISVDESKLIKNRHLDQMLMCSIYITARCMLIATQFQDIMKIYRLTWPKFVNKNHVYRNVYIDGNMVERDLIFFYNEIYIKSIKAFAVNMIKKQLVTCPSPVPKNNQIIINQFSPRKIVNSSNPYNIFVSPVKYQSSAIQTLPTPTSSSIQLIQPLANRNKLKFSFNDQNPVKSLDLINEMIKKNELKIKTSNKRLFSDISVHNTIPFNSNKTSATLSTNNASNDTTANEDESDCKIKKIQTIKTTINNNSPNNQNIFLNKMVGFKSPHLTLATRSATTPNLITMVVSNTNPTATSSSISSSFARKLQDIQSERNINK